jgi:hypothetical protein
MMDDDRVLIEFPDDFIETVSEWLESDDGSVGACLLCGVRYYSQADVDNYRCPQV